MLFSYQLNEFYYQFHQSLQHGKHTNQFDHLNKLFPIKISPLKA